MSINGKERKKKKRKYKSVVSRYHKHHIHTTGSYSHEDTPRNRAKDEMVRSTIASILTELMSSLDCLCQIISGNRHRKCFGVLFFFFSVKLVGHKQI